jgi:acetyl esterase/lipase
MANKTLLKPVVRLLKPLLSAAVPIPLQRVFLRLATSLFPVPRSVAKETVYLDGLPTERLYVRGDRPEHAILFLHGGGYCIGSPATHRSLTARLARDAEAEVLVPEYRLAPEHPHPAALEDALDAYRGLLARGWAPQRLGLAGDSAGGGLTIALAVAIREAGLPMPAGIALISPWTDLSLSGGTIVTHASRDPLLSVASVRRWSALYRGTRAADDPKCSPLYASLAGLPPLLIQVGSEEIVLDDARRLARRAETAGLAVRLQVYEGLWHDFHLQAGLLDDASAAIAELGDFFKAQWQVQNAAADPRAAAFRTRRQASA